MNSKTSVGSKVLTIAFCTLLVLLTIAAFVYLMVGPDFLTPDEYQQLYGTTAPTEPDGPDAPIDLSAEYEKALWNADMQDLLDYLLELGYIEEDGILGMAELCTEGHVCESGLDLLWWDVENLVEGTPEYDYWQEYQENGFIIYAGTVYTPTRNGPFATKVLSQFAGNEKQYMEDFMNFGKYLYEKEHGDDPVDLTAEYEKALWNGTYQDLLDYLEEKGHIDPDSKTPLTVMATENWLINGMDILWWDVDNLEENTEVYDYWNELEENGFIIFGGSIYAPNRYGPYTIWVGPNFTGDANALTEDMKDFGQYLYEKNNS